MNILTQLPMRSTGALPELTIFLSSIDLTVASLALIPVLVTAVALINPRTRARLRTAASQLDSRLPGATDRRTVSTRTPHSVTEEQTQPARLGWHVNRVTRALFGIATVLLVGDIVVQTVDVRLKPTFFGWSYLFRLFDLGNEASFGNWFAVVSIFLCALVLGGIALAKSTEGNRFARHWLALALLALALSIDEQAKLHDPGDGIGNRIRERFGFSGVMYYGWAFIALASAVAVVVIFRHFIRSLPATTRNSAILAAFFYVGGEAVIEVIDGWWLDAHGQDIVYRIMTCFEEYFGLIGVVVALSALMRYIRDHYGNVQIDLLATAHTTVPTTTPQQAPAAQPAIITVPQRTNGTRTGRERSGAGHIGAARS